MAKIKIPVTDMESNVVTVPDHDHLKKFQASTDALHGRGFYPKFMDKMAKVSPGTELNVLINDYFAIIDGFKVAYRGLYELNWDQPITFDVSSAVGLGDTYIVLKADVDGNGVAENKDGIFYLTQDVPNDWNYYDLGNGYTAIPVAKINIPDGTTQVTDDMIDNSVKKWLIDIDKGLWNLKKYVDEAVERAKREIYTFILGQYTDQIRDEIAAGVDAVRTELDSKIANVQSQIDDLNVTIEEIRNSLADLQTYVEQQIANLTTKTQELQDAFDALSGAVSENSDFIAQLQDNIQNIEGDVVSIQIELEKQLQMIEELENQNIVTVGKWEQSNAINIVKNTFRLSILDQKTSGSLKNGFYDTFDDASNIDGNNSSNFILKDGYITTGFSLPSGVVALWKMDTGTGGIIIDSSGNNNVGIIHNASWIDGRFGKALRFNGNGYVDLGYATKYPIYSSMRSLGIWIRTTSTSDAYIFSCGGGSWANFSLCIDRNGKLGFTAGKAWAYGDTLWSTNSYNDGSWHYVVISYDSAMQTKTLNIDNGAEIQSKVKAIYTYTSPNSCKIGTATFAPTYFFTGDVDEVVFVDRLFTDTEIQNFSTAPIGNSGDAVIQSIAYTASASPDTVMVAAEDTGNIVYEVSRDGGTTWTVATKNIETDISSQPAGTSLVLKATIPAGEKVDNWALLWS